MRRSTKRLTFGLTLTLCSTLSACGDPTPPAVMMPTDSSLTVSTGDFPVDAGTERTMCMYLPVPVAGDLAVSRFISHMPPGSHHFNFYYLPPGMAAPKQGLQDCRYDTIPVWLAGSQWPDLDYALPDGKAIKIPNGSWLMLESHFVNATTKPQVGHVDVTLHTEPLASVKDWVGVYFNIVNQQSIQVPPNSLATVTGRCSAHPGSSVFLFTSHMHHFGSAFDINLYDDAAGTTKPMYSSTDWEHPKIDEHVASPLVIGSDQGFEWKCHYHNDRSTVLRGGGSAVDNEMCIMAAFYYPAAPGVPYCDVMGTTTAN